MGEHRDLRHADRAEDGDLRLTPARRSPSWRACARFVAERGFALIGAGLHPDDPEEPELVDKPALRGGQGGPRQPAEDAALRPPRPRRHAGPRDRRAGLQRAPPPPAAAAGAERQLALPAGGGHRPGQRPGGGRRQLPRFEMPRAFRDYEDFLRVADQLIAAAGVDDYTYLWWDLRPHPKLGTVEVRGMDVQSRGRGQRDDRRPDPGPGGEGDRAAGRAAGALPRGARGVLLPGRPPRPRGAADGRRRERGAGP